MVGKREIILQVIALALAFGVGILVGRACQEPEKVTETVTVTVKEPGPERVVYECPPEETEPKPSKVGQKPPKVTQTKKKLPDAPKPITPKERQRLLGWVRDQSADLQGCRPASKETYRLAVTLELTAEGAVRRVRFNAPPRELPSSVQGCLRDRMSRWQPPAELVKDRKELVFGLTI